MNTKLEVKRVTAQIRISKRWLQRVKTIAWHRGVTASKMIDIICEKFFKPDPKADPNYKPWENL